jgi:hypothetical protein
MTVAHTCQPMACGAPAWSEASASKAACMQIGMEPQNSTFQAQYWLGGTKLAVP